MKVMLNARNESVQRMYRKFNGLVRRKCRTFLRNPVEAEDAAQEVFVRLLNHFDSIPSDAEAEAYIAACAANFCRNQLRNEKSQREKLQGLRDRELDEFEPRVEARQLVRKLVAEEDTDCRAAIVRYHFDDVDQGTIAKEQNVTRRTVINRLNGFSSRARDFVEKCELGEG